MANNSIADVEIDIRMNIDQLKTDIASANKMIRKGIIPPDAIREVAMIQGQLAQETEKLNEAMGKVPFAGYALSIMFFGQALQQMSLQIMRFGTKAFNEVMHSVEGTVTNTDYLQSSMKYLGFAIGEALDPVIGWLVPIVDAIADWVVQNPRLTASLVTFGAVLGGLLAAGGALKLAFDGFAQFGQVIGALEIGKNGTIKGSAGFLAFITNPAMLAGIAAITALSLISWKAFSESPEAFSKLKTAVSSLKEPINSLKDSILNILSAVFDMEISWEDVAWTLAWSGQLIIEGFIKPLINGFSTLFNSIAAVVNISQAVVNVLTAVSQATWGDFEGARASIAAVKRDFADAKKLFTEAGAGQIAIYGEEGSFKRASELLLMGPRGLRSEYQQEQFDQRTNVYIDRIEILQASGMTNAEIVEQILREAQATGQTVIRR